MTISLRSRYATASTSPSRYWTLTGTAYMDIDPYTGTMDSVSLLGCVVVVARTNTMSCETDVHLPCSSHHALFDTTYAIVMILLQKGASVVLGCREHCTSPWLHPISANEAGRLRVFNVDVTTMQGAEQLFSVATDLYGRIDHAIIHADRWQSYWADTFDASINQLRNLPQQPTVGITYNGLHFMKAAMAHLRHNTNPTEKKSLTIVGPQRGHTDGRDNAVLFEDLFSILWACTRGHGVRINGVGASDLWTCEKCAISSLADSEPPCCATRFSWQVADMILDRANDNVLFNNAPTWHDSPSGA